MKKSISLAFFLLVPAFLHSSWRVISDNGRETILEVTVEEPQLFLDRPGLSLGRLVSIPQSGGVILSILEEEKSDIPIEEFQERKGLPSKPAEVGRPGILRDFRVVNVRIHPLFREEGRAWLLKRIVLRLEYKGDGPNILNSIPKNSRDFQELYRAFILNYREPERESGPAIFSSEGAKMIIVTPDLYYDEVLPLAQWKTQKGIKTYVAKLSETGSQPSQIKFFLQNAYLNWDPAPEYVLLVGDANDIPVPGSPPSDNYYATLEGDDIFNDVYIGRFPASNAQEAAVMVSKTVNYERNPLMEDPLWFKKGTGIVRDDYDESDSIYYHDILHMADLMLQQGYIHVDTFTRAGGDDYYDVLEAINEGRSIAAYRGQGVGNWWTPFNIPIQSTNNGWKLPVIISTTCATINIDEPGNPYAGETWLKVGTAETPKGAVGFYGTVTVRSHVAEIRSAVFNGFV
ncbi:MAG: C25 family cysteine peptidase, partial [Thermoplasmata archaeon]